MKVATLLHRLHIGLITLALAMPGASHATEVLRILAWPGYADADIVRAFEQRHGIRAEVTYIDSDLDLWRKISNNKAKDYDVFAVNTAELQRYIRKDLAAPIDRRLIPNLSRQLPRFAATKNVPGIEHEGKLYGIPYTYSEMGLIYDKNQIHDMPLSIAALWDTRFQGKVIAYNSGTHSFSLAAQRLGTNPFSIAEDQWQRTVDALIALRRNSGGFYTHPEESVDLFIKRKAALMFANYGAQQVKLLQSAGVDVGYALPKEGALGWLDCWVITRGAKNQKLAAAWIYYMLEEKPGQALLERHGLANTTSESPHFRQDTQVVWLQPVENEDRRNLLWGRIVAGDRRDKVLRP